MYSALKMDVYLKLKQKAQPGFSDPSMHRYLDDIRKTSPCSKKSEQELFRLCREGNEKARSAIISANMRFVLKVVLNYRGCPIPMSDLVSIGAIGLVKAIEKFDHTRGLKFISYAVWWIKAYITKALNEEGSLIRLPANQYIKIRNALKANNDEELNDEIQELICLSRKGHSIETPLNEGSKATFADIFPDHNAEKTDMHVEIKAIESFTQEILADIPQREAIILKSLFGIGFVKPQNLREVGESLNVSHERVRQLRDQALRRIKNGKFKHIIHEKLEAQVEATTNHL